MHPASVRKEILDSSGNFIFSSAIFHRNGLVFEFIDSGKSNKTFRCEVICHLARNTLPQF